MRYDIFDFYEVWGMKYEVYEVFRPMRYEV